MRRAAVLTVLLLSACLPVDRAGLEAIDVEEADGRPAFAVHLAREYRDLALALGAGANAALFADKALMAARGSLAPPVSVAARPVARIDASGVDRGHRNRAFDYPGHNRPPHPKLILDEAGPVVGEAVVDLGTARSALLDVLARGARRSHPRESAEAQVRFDCWAHQASEGEEAPCRGEFERLMGPLREALAETPFAAEDPRAAGLAPCDGSAVWEKAYQIPSAAKAGAARAEVIDRALMEKETLGVCVN